MHAFKQGPSTDSTSGQQKTAASVYAGCCFYHLCHKKLAGFLSRFSISRSVPRQHPMLPKHYISIRTLSFPETRSNTSCHISSPSSS